MARLRRLWALPVLLLASCDLLVPTHGSTDPLTASHAIVTSDGTDSYTYTAIGTDLDARPLAGDSGGNLRTVFWPASGADEIDQQTCAVWTSQTGPLVQQGAALRINGNHVLTVTKNVIFGAQWIFNMHAWSGGTGTLFGQFDLRSVFDPDGDGTVVPLPWHLCARTLRGMLSFKVWPDSEREPGWGDSSHGGSKPIPAGWQAAGKAGWYVGHLPKDNGDAVFASLQTWRIDQ